MEDGGRQGTHMCCRPWDRSGEPAAGLVTLAWLLTTSRHPVPRGWAAQGA